ncbi:MAG: hypothetical protein P8L77_02700 [Gammaproteobacteria bacterium]|nr:hypothetical protein [Gammaproteobacteria bacterium]
MILVLGQCSDQVIGAFMHHCVKHSVDFAFVDLNQLGKSIDMDELYWFFPGQSPVSHSDITGVYNRFLDWPKQNKYQMDRLLSLFDWLDHRYENVINRPKDTMSNLSKPYQLDIASQFFSWSIPKTNIIMNTQIKIKSPFICKSISSERSIVNQVYRQEEKAFYEPALLQAYIPGLNIRVHACDDVIVAVGIQSDAVDYRYSRFENDIFMYHLPGQVEKDILALNRTLGLRFSGVDLIYHNKKYYFLEANPSPGYAYFESQLSRPYISEALVSSLSRSIH